MGLGCVILDIVVEEGRKEGRAAPFVFTYSIQLVAPTGLASTILGLSSQEAVVHIGMKSCSHHALPQRTG